MGFPPGVAEQMVYQHFQKWQDEHQKRNPVDPKLPEKWKKYEEERQKQAKEQAEAQAKAKESSDKPEAKTEEVKVEPQIEVIKKEGIEMPKPDIKKEAPKQEQQPKDTKPVDQKMIDISTYNGDATEKYKWSQQFNEVQVQIDIPKGTKGKDLLVVMKSTKLKVQLKSQPEPIIDGELDSSIKPDDSFWTIEDSTRLILTLAKANETIWKTVIKGDQEIDPTKVDNSKELKDFDEETQGHLRKVLYEQQRKNAGLPTTEEMKQEEAMKKVWDAPNSPFKGMPYDPSVFTSKQPQVPFNHP